MNYKSLWFWPKSYGYDEKHKLNVYRLSDIPPLCLRYACGGSVNDALHYAQRCSIAGQKPTFVHKLSCSHEADRYYAAVPNENMRQIIKEIIDQNAKYNN